MESMNVTLPTLLKKFVDDRIAAGSFSTPSDYIRQLIRDDQEREARRAIERQVLEGIESGSTSMTEDDWEELRQEIEAKAAKRKVT